MDYWSNEKLDRVLSLIEASLPSRDARVLEYGCGTGTFAMALKQRFPNLDVHGCDISPKGIEKARARCAEVNYHLLGDRALPSASYDVVYTHHVLEHVQDLEATVADIARLVKPDGTVLHILPCGNAGSVEHRLASLARNGISKDGSGLFFLDDISHVRRLTSAELQSLREKYGLSLEHAFFANQIWSGFEYLTAQLYWGLFNWLNPKRAKNTRAAIELFILLMVCMPISLLRVMPPHIIRSIGDKRPFWKRMAFYLLLPFAAVVYPLSRLLNWTLIRIREWEWKEKKNRPNGGEMYLAFRKSKVTPLQNVELELQSTHV